MMVLMGITMDRWVDGWRVNWTEGIGNLELK